MPLFCNIDINGVKDCIQDYSSDYKAEVRKRVTGESCTQEQAEEFFAIPTYLEVWLDYYKDAATQIVAGKYTEKGNLLGTIGEIGLAFTGADFIQDLRDLSYDIIRWEEVSLGETLLDGVSLFPLVGMLGKSDEMLLVFKRSDPLFEIRKAKNLDDLIEGLEGAKYFSKSSILSDTAQNAMKRLEPKEYHTILTGCEAVPAYRLAYGTAGTYDNPVVTALFDYADDLTYIQSKSPDLAKETITEVAQTSGKSSEELKELAREIIDEAREKAEEVVESGSSSAIPDSVDIRLKALVGEIRTDIGKEYPVGNVGAAITDIEGVTPEIKAYSKFNNSISSQNINHEYSYNLGSNNRIFDTVDVNSQNIVDGPKAFNRCIDTESKILEDIAHQLGYNTFAVDESVVGNVYLITERAPCPSCEGVIAQFKEMFPNVNVEVKYMY